MLWDFSLAVCDESDLVAGDLGTGEPPVVVSSINGSGTVGGGGRTSGDSLSREVISGTNEDVGRSPKGAPVDEIGMATSRGGAMGGGGMGRVC